MLRILISVLLLLALCGFEPAQERVPGTRADLERAKPEVTMGPQFQVSKSAFVRAAAISADGRVHLLVAERGQNVGWSTCDLGTVSHVIVGTTGVEHEEAIYEKPPCKQLRWRWPLYDLGFDSGGRVHAVVLDRNLVREGGRWREDPAAPCERYSRGSGELACTFTIGAKDIGVSTIGKQVAMSLLVTFLSLGHITAMPNESVPLRIAIARLSASGWGDIAVLEADDDRSGSMFGGQATLVTDAQNRLRIVYGSRVIDDLEASITGEGQLKRTTPEGSEVALPMRKASGKEAKGLVRAIGFSKNTPQFSMDPQSGRVLRLSEGVLTEERAAQIGRSRWSVGVMESQIGEGGSFALPQEVFILTEPNLSAPRPVPAPYGGFQFAVPVQTGFSSNSCRYDVRYYVRQQERWSAPLVLESGITKQEDCSRFFPSQALVPQIASSAGRSSFVAWSSNGGVAGRWIEFPSASSPK